MRLLRASVWAFAVVALTGLGLMFYYVPTLTPQVVAGTAHKAITLGGLLRGTHFMGVARSRSASCAAYAGLACTKKA